MQTSNLKDRQSKPMKLAPNYLLASQETISKMKQDWAKLYPDIPFSIGIMIAKILENEKN